jgi:Stress up-regulated Nod 19
MVLVNIGPGRRDATCAENPFSLPHILLGTSPTTSERMFSSGNERTEAFLPDWNIGKVGYKLNKADKFALIVDLMNENPAASVVYLTISYDFVPGHPEDYDHMRPVWLDIAQCMTSEYPAMRQAGSFYVDAPTWKATFDGDVVGLAGHLHDGGQAVLVTSDGKVACNSTASYGGKPEYFSKHPMAHGSATEHISKMKVCAGENVGVIKMVKGQSWNLKAIYNYDMNKGDLHGDGKQANVMGIAIMFVREKRK